MAALCFGSASAEKFLVWGCRCRARSCFERAISASSSTRMSFAAHTQTIQHHYGKNLPDPAKRRTAQLKLSNSPFALFDNCVFSCEFDPHACKLIMQLALFSISCSTSEEMRNG